MWYYQEYHPRLVCSYYSSSTSVYLCVEFVVSLTNTTFVYLCVVFVVVCISKVAVHPQSVD